MQKHNRQMSFSLYICALAVSDTVALLTGMSDYSLSRTRAGVGPNQIHTWVGVFQSLYERSPLIGCYQPFGVLLLKHLSAGLKKYGGPRSINLKEIDNILCIKDEG